jgi:hypothetical protein
MATLTNEDFKRMQQMIRGDSVAKEEIVGVLSRPQLRATLQGLEDWWESTATQLSAKAAMDTAAGETLSNTLAKKIGKLWMANKFGGL